MPASVPFAGAALFAGALRAGGAPLRSVASVLACLCVRVRVRVHLHAHHTPRLRPLHSATSESPGAIVRRPHLHARARVPWCGWCGPLGPPATWERAGRA